jgi:hypothetical protein
MSVLDRALGKLAWSIFWTIISGVCICLKLFYRLQPEQNNNKLAHRVHAHDLPSTYRLEIQNQLTGPSVSERAMDGPFHKNIG